MKKLLFAFLILPAFVNGQTFKPDENMKSSFTDEPAHLVDTVVVSVYKKDQLYSNALAYLSNSFNDSRNVVEAKDRELGEISFKGNTSKKAPRELKDKKGKVTYYNENVILFFKCKLYLKDEKFKIILSSLEYPVAEMLGTDLRFTIRDKESEGTKANNQTAKELAISLIQDLAKAINKKPESDF